MMIHGAGFVEEYPTVVYVADWQDWGYDAHFEENMVVCVESFIGEVGGSEAKGFTFCAYRKRTAHNLVL